MADTPTLEEIWQLIKAMHELDRQEEKWMDTVTDEICRLKGRVDRLEDLGRGLMRALHEMPAFGLRAALQDLNKGTGFDAF